MRASAAFLSPIGIIAVTLLGQHSPAAEPAAPEAIGRIERLDPALDKLVPPEAKLEKVAEGFEWSEGPLWVKTGGAPDSGFLLFSDVPKNLVYRWSAKDGLGEFMKPSGYTGNTPRGGEPGSNGLTLDPQGRLVMCEHGDRRVSRVERDGTKTTLVDKFEGKRLNSPNDVVFDSKGNFYFTDPPYGLEGNNKDPKKELDFNGVFRVSADGKPTLVTREMSFPNGVALSPDEKTLYVANSDGSRAVWLAFEVKDDGSFGASRVVLDVTPLTKTLPGGPDGMKVDEAGNLFATGPGGVLVITPEGKHLGTIHTGVPTGNVAWGEDGSVLYVTADMYLGRMKLATKGRVLSAPENKP